MESSTSQELKVPTQIFREKIRSYLQEQRQINRERNNDAARFGLAEINEILNELNHLTVMDVKAIASRIKRRKHALDDDMYRLSHAFLQNHENINQFANTTGALQVIVKELTGTDAKRQLGAVECLCNMSLGEEFVCLKLGILAGSYLVTYLDSNEPQLKRTSLWTLTNIISTSREAVNLLQLELVPKLWSLYCADDVGHEVDENNDFRTDAGNCLQLIAVQSDTCGRTKDRIFIMKNLHLKNWDSLGSAYYLKIIFHFDIANSNYALEIKQLLHLIDFCLYNIKNTHKFSMNENRMRILYAVRTLTNLLATQETAYALFLRRLTELYGSSLLEFLNKLFAFNETALTDETLWLSKTVMDENGKSSSPFDVNDLIRNLKIFGTNSEI